MIYCISDVHGEYGLFERLLDKIGFSDGDLLYILGDVIDKGEWSLKLAKRVSSMQNVRTILGNHEYNFQKFYRSILAETADDFDGALDKIRAFFPVDRELLDWDLVDWFEDLPAYYETDRFVCVHAGAPLDGEGRLLPLSEASVEQLLYDRRFKDPAAIQTSPKCVFFGHTQTNCICGEPRVLCYPRDPSRQPATVSDFYKIHLDTGTWSNGVLGCFCVDTLETVYVTK